MKFLLILELAQWREGGKPLFFPFFRKKLKTVFWALGCALNWMHVVYFCHSIFFFFLYLFTSLLDLLAWVLNLSFLKLNSRKKCCLLPITAKIAVFKETLHRKTCQDRDSSQLLVMNLPFEWRVVHSRDVGESYLL